MNEGPHTYAIDFVIGLLRADETLAAAGVEIISQNDGEVAKLIQKEVSQLNAPVAVVTVDKLANNAPGVRVAGTVAVTECVPLNRRAGKKFLTALDVAVLAQIALDRHDVHSGEVAHGTPGKGILEATCQWELELLVKSEPNETQTETSEPSSEGEHQTETE